LKDYIEERALEIASYMILTKATVRQTAKIFKVSKSTVHKDISERLPRINPNIWESIRKVLDSNKAERHIRGGRATRLKYKMGNCMHRGILKKNVDKKGFMIKSRI